MARKGFKKAKFKPTETAKKEDSVNDVLDRSSKDLTEIHDYDVSALDDNESVLLNATKWVADHHRDSEDKIIETEVLVEDVEAAVQSDIKESKIAVERPIQEKINKTVSFIDMDEIEDDNINHRTTTIGEDVVINGDIKIRGSLEFYGNLTGDILSVGDINLSNSARIEGKIKGRNLIIANGIQSNVITIVDDDPANKNKRTKVVGDIYVESLESSGIIEGNVFVNKRSYLTETSVLEGNLSTKQLEVKNGAVINGHVTIDSQ